MHFDGHFIYSDIERTICDAKNISSVIYPVPATDILNVVIRSDLSAKTRLLVYESSGKLVRSTEAALLQGNNSFKVDVTGLAAGAYMMRSSNTEIGLTRIFTIVR